MVLRGACPSVPEHRRVSFQRQERERSHRYNTWQKEDKLKETVCFALFTFTHSRFSARDLYHINQSEGNMLNNNNNNLQVAYRTVHWRNRTTGTRTAPSATCRARLPQSWAESRRCRPACRWRWCWWAAGSWECAAGGSERTPGVRGSYQGSPGRGWIRGRRQRRCDTPGSEGHRWALPRSCDRCWGCCCAGRNLPWRPGYHWWLLQIILHISYSICIYRISETLEL